MALNLYEASGDLAGIFNILGKAFAVFDSLDTARRTTIPTAVKEFIDRYKLKATNLSTDQMLDAVAGSADLWAGSGNTITSQLIASLETFLIQEAVADSPDVSPTIEAALEYLIAQMVDQEHYVDPSSDVSLILNGSANVAIDVNLGLSFVRGDGQRQDNTIGEVLDVTVENVNGLSASLLIEGEVAQTDLMREDWPKGSGVSASIPTQSTATSLLTNGGFEDSAVTNIPDSWIIDVGTVGTTIKLTALEVQTVAISGTPTGGSYWLKWANNGATQSTSELTYNADGGLVQTALRKIPGLEEITISTSGTSPNYTHTITFAGAPGNPSQLTSINKLTGGSAAITHNTTVAASAGSHRGRAFEIASNGSESQSVLQAVTLAAETVYFMHVRMAKSGTSAGGSITYQLVDGVGGSVLADAEGVNNTFAKNVADLGIAAGALEPYITTFRIKDNQRQPVYLRIYVTGVDNAVSIYIDDLILVEGSELYDGGPFVAAFQGRRAQTLDMTWTLDITNARDNALQDRFNRAFRMAERGFLLPTAGTTLIPDSVIS